jgi:hypothetical protein
LIQIEPKSYQIIFLFSLHRVKSWIFIIGKIICFWCVLELLLLDHSQKELSIFKAFEILLACLYMLPTLIEKNSFKLNFCNNFFLLISNKWLCIGWLNKKKFVTFFHLWSFKNNNFKGFVISKLWAFQTPLYLQMVML